MNEFQIETGIPIPQIRRRGKSGKYPFRELKIGDSFLVPNQDRFTIKRLRSACHNFSKRNPDYMFTVKEEVTGCRVWRIPCES